MIHTEKEFEIVREQIELLVQARDRPRLIEGEDQSFNADLSVIGFQRKNDQFSKEVAPYEKSRVSRNAAPSATS